MCTILNSKDSPCKREETIMQSRKAMVYAVVVLFFFIMIITYGHLEVGASDDDYMPPSGSFFPDIHFGSEHIQHAKTRRELIPIQPGFISIDCGETEDYNDEPTGIFFQTDAEFISTGKNQKISSYSKSLTNYNKQATKLRSFDEGKKNCYNLKPDGGKDQKYLFRASFMYGNYDGKNKVPKFDLYLGVNFWVTVTLNDAEAYSYEEIIFVPSTDVIHVCLVNTGSGTPFISVLELRLLDNSLYTELPPITTYQRFDVGSDVSLRYKDDVYDRIWGPTNYSNWNSTETDQIIDTSGNSAEAGKPPEKVFRTGIKPIPANDSIYYSWNNFDRETENYVYFHFAELEVLPEGTQRELHISLNGDSFTGEQPIKLEYLKATTISTSKWPMEGDSLYFYISTKDSKLPPVLNGLEIFQAKNLSLLPTNQDDVDGIMDIKKNMEKEKKDWQGDPCLPINTTWQGLNCSDDRPPRITSLNLSSSGLTGDTVEILSSFLKLKSLRSLDLSYNNLRGPLPGFLEQLPLLNTLVLIGNNLTGSIPQALQQKVKDKTLVLRVDENPNLSVTDSSQKKKTVKLVPILVPVVSVLILVLLAGPAIFWTLKWKRRREMEIVEAGKKGSVKSTNRRFTFSEIVSSTNKFERVIGKGRSGTVYHGYLKDDTQIAVKILSPSSTQTKEFHTEVQLLMRIHHRNLAPLVGYCDEGTNMALIYEYMANGNLQQHLSDKSKNVLSWKERIQIAVDSAQGLEYLHKGCKPHIIHRDMKTANILLNDELQAKISDFGISRIFETETESHVSTIVMGTRGYLDPEYYTSNKLNEKSDVYSFGVVLLELITGQPPIIKDTDIIHIVKWVSSLLAEGDIQRIVDPRLRGDFNINSAWKILETAMACVPSTAIQRPSMSHVLMELKECLEIETSRDNWRMQSNNTTGPNSSFELALLDPRIEMVPSPC